MTDLRSYFITFNPTQPGASFVTGVSGKKLSVLRKGTVKIKINFDDGTHERILHNVLSVPEFGGNLLSIGVVSDSNFQISIKNPTLKFNATSVH